MGFTMNDMSDVKKLDLSDESLGHLLNFILSMIKQDRQNALNQYTTLSSLISGPDGFAGLDGIMLNDIANGLSSFMKNSAQSTDQAIKIAGILANHLIKMDKSSTLTDDDRLEIEKLGKELIVERDSFLTSAQSLERN